MSNKITIKESLKTQQNYIQNHLEKYIEWHSERLQRKVRKAVDDLSQYNVRLMGDLDQEEFVKFFDKELSKVRDEIHEVLCGNEEDYVNGTFSKFRDSVRDYIKEKLEFKDE